MVKRGIHRHQQITSKIINYQNRMQTKERKIARQFEKECKRNLLKNLLENLLGKEIEKVTITNEGDPIKVTNHGKFDFIVSGKIDVYVKGNRKASNGDIISVRIPAFSELGMNVGKHMICKVVAYMHGLYNYKARIL